jgi:hypothetical protein
MTALGVIDLRRSHGYCTKCDLPCFAADGLLGIDGFMTVRARSMACLAGLNEPFRKADTLLTALAGWHVCAENIRKCCHQGAADARERRDELDGLPEKFDQAQGQDREAHLDAGKVNTPDGWRDIKLVVFACRERGESSTSADYEQRDLPAPSVRSVVAEVEEARAFGPRCKAEAERLGVVETSAREAGRSRTVDTSAPKVGGLSVLGDGAEWIWNLADQQFAGAAQLLDVYHGVEKLAEAGREEFGQGTAALEQWLDEARGKLVADGYDGVCEALMRPPAGEVEGVGAGVGEDERRPREMMGGVEAAAVLNYFCGHQVRLGYAGRLCKGQVIGSGLVEGTIKQRVNVRMKRGSARWLPEHAGPFVELMAMADTIEWSEFWALMAL